MLLKKASQLDEKRKLNSQRNTDNPVKETGRLKSLISVLALDL